MSTSSCFLRVFTRALLVASISAARASVSALICRAMGFPMHFSTFCCGIDRCAQKGRAIVPGMGGLFRSTSIRLLIFVYLCLVAWWLTIYARGLQETTENYLFSLLYTAMPLGWGMLGLINASQWG